jgi:hypothetical protein
MKRKKRAKPKTKTIDVNDPKLKLIAPPSTELWNNVARGLNSFDKEDRSFDCRCCGTHYTPAKDQWVFHELCDKCFAEFDAQKMKGRFSGLGWNKSSGPYTESTEEWIKMKKGQS